MTHLAAALASASSFTASPPSATAPPDQTLASEFASGGVSATLNSLDSVLSAPATITAPASSSAEHATTLAAQAAQAAQATQAAQAAQTSTNSLTLLSVPLLVAVALALTPLFVKLLGRHAGWPIVAFFLASVVQLSRVTGDILDGTTFTWSRVWSPELNAAFALKLDPLSMVFSFLALLVGSIVFIYSTAYLPPKKSAMSFYVLMTAFMLAVLLLVLADDIMLLFIGWELVSMASFLLIARSGSSGELGSLRTLLLTFTGGLLLLAALGGAVWLTGSTNLTEVLASPEWEANPTARSLIAALVALGAFTKAAQFPFHAWLPEAMAAATPVSAFLHAAAVVKAGVYLLMRFSTVFADVRVWQLLLIVMGMWTAVATAYFALQQTDLKKLIAYSTVSQLGWIVATIGVGTKFAIMAAVVHTIAHAMFKSSLFMMAGVVDHQAGTRDIRRLGPLWKQMPWSFGSMIFGAASMAAIPPFFGFMSKEGMLTAFEGAPLSNTGVVILLTVAAIGAIGTFAYSARLVFGAFVDGPRNVDHITEAPVSLWLPAAIPGGLSLPAAFAAGAILNRPLDRVADTVGQLPAGATQESHLSLWHGVNVPLIISVIVLAVGVGFIFTRARVGAVMADRKLFPFTGVEAINASLSVSQRVGRAMGKVARSHQPSRHLLPLLGLLAVYALVIAIAPGVGGAPVLPKIDDIDHLTDLIPLVVVVIGVWATLRAKNRLQAAVLLSVTGVGVTLQILLLGAPDVALTQFMVEILTVVLMMLVLRFQPRAFSETSKNRRASAAIVAVAVGLATFGAVWFLTGRRQMPEVAQWYIDNTEKVTGETNIVNVILVEFRAFDTMGELAVLGMAGVAMAAVVTSMPRFPHLLDQPSPLAEPALNSIMMRWLVRWLSPVLFALSAVVLYRGGTAPGGGFNAALIGAAAVMLIYLSKDRDELVFGEKIPVVLSAAGVITAIGTGFIGFAKGSFLAPLYGEFLGQHLTTALLFDVGVYLAVIGIVATALNLLGGPNRPGVTGADDVMQDLYSDRSSLRVPPEMGVFASETESASAPAPAHATVEEAKK